jgi:hypothetical protein
MQEFLMYAVSLPVASLVGYVAYRWGKDRGREEHADDCWIEHRAERDWREREGWTV